MGTGRVLQKPNPAPKEAGIYGWYFNETPTGVPLAGPTDTMIINCSTSGFARKSPLPQALQPPGRFGIGSVSITTATLRAPRFALILAV